MAIQQSTWELWVISKYHMLVKMSLHIHAMHFMASMGKRNARENVIHYKGHSVVTRHILEKVFHPFIRARNKSILALGWIFWKKKINDVCFAFCLLKQIIYFLLQTEFIAAVSFQAPYLKHIRGDSSRAAILFCWSDNGRRKISLRFYFPCQN